MKSFRKLKLYQGLKTTVILLVVLSILLWGFLSYTVQRSLPLENGAIALPSIKSEVTIKRDQWGIPHIYATNSHDLFMAQGYIHAQDRFWQMDAEMKADLQAQT
ncbi:probable penicillin amidase [Trichormus variabilis ATCC 29413]|uniref:Probable penicillin amidase n=1 Tax=Trichormus variabilis (strain ATCC 29413 / PCC 7937) TaxID=240292 RepID=Q3MC91_TRIV2|nr:MULTISPECIES: penicillin acylase family protein [Nostocaceae]ABA21395.1 probable penicillin amidase [Trichormus variabilis ATCC 29413]